MVPSDAHMQGGQYIPAGSFDCTSENGADDQSTSDYGMADNGDK